MIVNPDNSYNFQLDIIYIIYYNNINTFVMPLNKTDLFMHTMTDIMPVTKGIIGYGIRNHNYHKKQATNVPLC